MGPVRPTGGMEGGRAGCMAVEGPAIDGSWRSGMLRYRCLSASNSSTLSRRFSASNNESTAGNGTYPSKLPRHPARARSESCVYP